MTDPWKELARAERKLEQMASKGMLKLEKNRQKLARDRERLDCHLDQREEAAERRREGRAERHEHRRDRLQRRRRVRREGAGPAADATQRSRPRRSEPTVEERAYRDARKRANAKIGFLTHFISYVSVLAFILVTSHNLRATLIVAASWGIGIAIHYFATVVAPGLRTRLIEDEVGRSVAQGVRGERQAAGVRHERSLEDLSSSIAHEIRNPVTAAKNLVQQMGEDAGSRRNVEYARVALEELDRVERSISHLLRYARDEEIVFESFDMADVVEAAVESFRERIDLLTVELEIQLDTRGRMRGDAEKVRRVLVNLIGNALDALAQGDAPVPRLAIMAGENLAGTEVWVRVRDNGPGIKRDVLPKVFSPFFTTKDKGNTLGLALSKKVVDAHGGRLEVESNTETGTEFVVTFPKDAGGVA